MKKVLSLILATLLVLTSIAAVAEEVLPSKTTSDLAEVVTENGEAIIIIVEDSAKLETVLADTLASLLNGGTPVALYTEATQTAVADKVGEAALDVHEMVAIASPSYTADMGAVTAKFSFPTLYTAEQTVLAVVSVYTGEAVEEIVLDATVNEDGTVTITFPADVMAKITAADDNILAILNTK